LQARFSSFPSGLPGSGLCVLRVGLATYVVARGAAVAALLAAATDLPTAAIGIAGVMWLLSGGCIAAGFLTPVVQLLVASTELAAIGLQWWATGSAVTLVDSSIEDLLALMMAVSLALLGPGAYSIDARLFGRREITIPRLVHRSTSEAS
jgi:uncharacterized membrane protein YphA (DoxX/SURF4 family)